jgi:hypothetical protein
MGSQTSEVPSDPEDWQPPAPEPLEIDALEPPPPGGSGPSNTWCTTSARSSLRPRCCATTSKLKILVESSYPLRVVLHNPIAIGNIAKWAVELAEFELDFVSHHAVKSQVLTDFIVNWTPPTSHSGALEHSELDPRAPVFTRPHWTLFFDGSSHKQGAGVGVLFLTPDGEPFKYMVHLDFKATNNMVEYEALLFVLSTTLLLGVRQLLMKGDS